MYKLVLVRHGQSEWNLENRFTGWKDVKLSYNGILEAQKAGRLIKEAGFRFGVIYTSRLNRAIETALYICDFMDKTPQTHHVAFLNERHYGALQGLNKEETAKKYGEEQVKLWRRSADVRPPLLEDDDPRFIELTKKYTRTFLKNIPRGESLMDTYMRVKSGWRRKIKPNFHNTKQILIVAHGNSIRALLMYLEKINKEDIVNLEIPTGVPLVLEFSKNFKITKKYYLSE